MSTIYWGDRRPLGRRRELLLALLLGLPLAGAATYVVLSVPAGHGPTEPGKRDEEQAQKREPPSSGPTVKPPVQTQEVPGERDVSHGQEQPPAPPTVGSIRARRPLSTARPTP